MDNFPLPKGTKVSVDGIMWDVDYAPDLGILPTELTYQLPFTVDDIEELEFEVSEWLSNEYGYCHHGFTLSEYDDK